VLTHILYSCTDGKVIVLTNLSKKLRALGVRGASVSNLSRIFQGQHDPGYHLVKGLAKVFEVPIEEVEVILKKCREALQYVNNRLATELEDELETSEIEGGC